MSAESQLPAVRPNDYLPVLPWSEAARDRALQEWISSSQVWASVDVSTADGQALVLRARVSADLDKHDLFGRPFLVKGLIGYVKEQADEKTGEIRLVPVLNLILSDGSLAGFTSGGIWQSVREFCRYLGAPPWDPPLRCSLRKKLTAKKREIWFLDLCPEPAT